MVLGCMLPLWLNYGNEGEEQSKNNPDFKAGIWTLSDFFALVLQEYTMFSSLEGSVRTSEDRGTQLRRMLGVLRRILGVPFGEWTACSLYLLGDGDGSEEMRTDI